MGVVGPEVVLAAPARDVPSIPVRGDIGVIADALVPFEPTSSVVGYGEEVIGGFMADPASAVGRPRREHAVALGGVPAARGRLVAVGRAGGPGGAPR
ncbi:hypothetical protein [Streptomyces sp. NPDC088847]|uniref:hypothetical protein n=1 Tax=Streptomyces sp. NPDC088847 TaxID=3365909 RepID=UPI003810AE2D